MDFGHGATVYRQRARQVLDPYSQKPIPADWTNPDELALDGAFVASSSTAVTATATRTQVLEAKSLYLDDPDADVREGDRIRVGGLIYTIDGFPAADMNPFTGWQPVRELPLTRSKG